MNAEQKTLCAKIIHTAAASAAAGNAVPVPGFGAAADLTAVLGMAAALSKVFNVKCNFAKHTIMMACINADRGCRLEDCRAVFPEGCRGLRENCLR